MDMGLHFLPRHKPWLQDSYTWIMKRDGQEVWSQTDYILGTDRRLFQVMDGRDTQHDLYYYIFMGCLMREPAKDLTVYLRKPRRFPLLPLRRDLAMAPENIFSELKTQIPKPPLNEWVRRAWIYDKNWPAIYARVTARREEDQRTVRQLSRQIRAGLCTDQKIRAEEAGRTIESLLALDPPPLVREAWVWMWGWYRDAANRSPPGVYIPGDPYGGICGALHPRPASG